MNEITLLLVLCGIALFALFSGPISRGSLTPPMTFTALGLLLSPIGFGWINLEVGNSIIHTVAEITLILVLFTDAARINLKTLWSDHDVPMRLLLVGMPLTIAAGTFAAKAVLPELLLVEALILAIILSSSSRSPWDRSRVFSSVGSALSLSTKPSSGVFLPASSAISTCSASPSSPIWRRK